MMKPVTRRRWLRHAAGLAVQLGIVFVGVYAAFLLNRWQTSAAERRADAQLYALLSGEVESVAVGLDMQRTRFDSLYFDPFVADSTPDLPLRPYYQINGDLTSPELESVLAAGGMVSARPGLLPAIRMYNMSTRYHMKISDELRRMSTDHLAPALGSGRFYDDDGRVRPEYRWYPALVSQHRGSMDATIAAAESLAVLLQSPQR